MIGAIIGDIVGSRFEFNNHRSKEFDLFGKGCFATGFCVYEDYLPCTSLT